jgi:uncharacterized membrane-anchored protein
MHTTAASSSSRRTPPKVPVKRNIASLVGGVAIAVGVFILWLLVAGELGYAPATLPVVLSGLIAAGVVGGWIRLADL